MEPKDKKRTYEDIISNLSPEEKEKLIRADIPFGKVIGFRELNEDEKKRAELFRKRILANTIHPKWCIVQQGGNKK